MSQFFAGVPVELRMRNDLHLARKAWHMTMGFVIVFVFLSTGMSSATAVMIMGSVLGVSLLVETARLRIPAFNEKVLKLWGPFMRSSEINHYSGVPHYVAATVLAFGIFPRPVAVLSILYLACGDPIASLFGVLYGKYSVRLGRGKSLIGTIAGTLACAVVTLLFAKAYPLTGSDFSILVLTVVGGLAGGLAELVPLEMDDNFTIPVISGFVLWLAFIVLGF